MYGSTWVFMLDVSKDLQPINASHNTTSSPDGIDDAEKIGQLGTYDVLEPLVNDSDPPTKKQKLSPATKSHARQEKRDRKRKRNTGAGDEMHLHEREGGVGPFVRRFKDAEGQDEEMIDLDANAAVEDGMDVDGEDKDGDVLALMRRGEEVTDGTEKLPEATTTVQSKPKRSWPHWYTFEYNSILGISVIGPSTPDHSPEALSTLPHSEGKSEGASGSDNIEVIIVERPMYDVEQVPRFDGGQEWDV